MSNAQLSDYERQIQAYRDGLLRRDDAILSITERGWRIVQRGIWRDLDRLLKRIADAEAKGEKVKPSWLRDQIRSLDLLPQVEAQITQWALSLAPTITAGQEAAITMAGEHAEGLVRAQLGDRATWNTLPVSAVQETIGRLADGSPLVDYLRGFGPAAATAAEETLIAGVATGRGVKAIAADLAKIFGQSGAVDPGSVGRRAMLTARSSVLSAYRQSSLLNYQNNSDVVTAWIWTCAKSSRTCMSCISRDGKVYPLDTFMPAHLGCRCSLRPKTKTYRELGIDAPEPVGTIETGAQWFARQDDSTQRQMMGIAAHGMWRQGKISLTDFEGLRHDARWGDQAYQRPLREIVARG